MKRTSFGTLLLLAGCYTYRPLANPDPEPGHRVSAQLTTDGSRDLTGQIGPEVLHVEGQVVSADSSGLDLEVLEIESFRGIRSDWNGEHVRLPRQAGAGVRDGRPLEGGTTLLGGVVVGGLYAIYRLFGGGSSVEGAGG